MQCTHFYTGRPQGACVIRTWRGGVKFGQILKRLPVHSVSLAEKTLLLLMIFLTALREQVLRCYRLSRFNGLLPEGAHLRASSGLTWVSEDFIDRADRRCNRMAECCTESIKSGF